MARLRRLVVAVGGNGDEAGSPCVELPFTPLRSGLETAPWCAAILQAPQLEVPLPNSARQVGAGRQDDSKPPGLVTH